MKSKRAPHCDLETIMPLLIGVWRRFHKESGPSDRLQTREFRRIVEAIKILEAQHDGQASLLESDYFSKKELLGAYVLYQWVLHYQQGLSLIGELPRPPKRVLDLCSGPACFAFAALRWGAEEVIAVDRNVEALEVGAEICGRYGMPLTIRRWDYTKKRDIPVEGKFDLIVLGYCLEELFPPTGAGWEERQTHFIDNLLSRLSPQGHLLQVESSFPQQNRRLLALRDRLVAKGIGIQAPCIWRGECPSLQVQNNPCYAQREMVKPYLIKELQRAAGINLSSLKMSYIIFRAPEAAWPELPTKQLYRVISPAIDSFRGKRHYLCGSGGKKFLESRIAQHPLQSKAFEFLRRGEVISLEDVLEQQSGFEITTGSSLKVEAACGKPLDAHLETEEPQ